MTRIFWKSFSRNTSKIKKMSKKDDTRSTQVDLGDDLIASARITLKAKKAKADASADSQKDQLESARILAGEGLFEEAKRVLRKILISDPRYTPARKKLEELQEDELKKLLAEGEEQKHRYRVKKVEEDQPFEGDPRVVEEQLDQELGLGLDWSTPDLGETLDDVWFGSPESLREFVQKLDREVSGNSARDLLDLGIGFLEMDLPKIAAHLFTQSSKDAEWEHAARALHADALLRAGNALEAAQHLDLALRNPEIPNEQKIELSYWMGRSQEALGRVKSAIRWYESVLLADSQYRDCLSRKTDLQKK